MDTAAMEGCTEGQPSVDTTWVAQPLPISSCHYPPTPPPSLPAASLLEVVVAVW